MDNKELDSLYDNWDLSVAKKILPTINNNFLLGKFIKFSLFPNWYNSIVKNKEYEFNYDHLYFEECYLKAEHLHKIILDDSIDLVVFNNLARYYLYHLHNLSLMKLFIKTDEDKKNALEFSIKVQWIDMMEYLFDYCEVKLPENYENIFMFICELRFTDIRLIEYLTEKGANIRDGNDCLLTYGLEYNIPKLIKFIANRKEYIELNKDDHPLCSRNIKGYLKIEEYKNKKFCDSLFT